MKEAPACARAPCGYYFFLRVFFFFAFFAFFAISVSPWLVSTNQNYIVVVERHLNNQWKTIAALIA